jgi:hypothetical protein
VTAGVLAHPVDVLADGVVLSELHAASIVTASAAQTTSATEEYPRDEFTVVTLHPRHAILATSPRFGRSVHERRRGSQHHWATVQYGYVYR